MLDCHCLCEFSLFASRKSNEYRVKRAKKVTTETKTVFKKKNTDGNQIGANKVPRYGNAVGYQRTLAVLPMSDNDNNYFYPYPCCLHL